MKLEITCNGKSIPAEEFIAEFAKANGSLSAVLTKLLSNAVNKINKAVPEVVKKNLTYYEKRLAKKWGMTLEEVINYLEDLSSKNIASAISLVLKEIAIDLDEKYDSHISKAENIYVISLSDGEISKMDKKYITTYQTFAAFRTIEDADFAKYVLRRQFANIYGGKQKD